MNREERRWHEREARRQARAAGVPESELANARLEITFPGSAEAAHQTVLDTVARQRPVYGYNLGPGREFDPDGNPR